MAVSSKTSNSTTFSLLALLLITTMVSRANGQGAGCAGDMQGVIMNCARFVQKAGPVTDPTQECCGVLKTLDIPCVCAHIPPEAAAIIDMNKVLHVVSFCAIQIPHGLKCGSFAVPPAVAVNELMGKKKET